MELYEKIGLAFPGAKYILRGNELADLEWLDEDIKKPTLNEIEQKVSATQYQRDRASAYPSIQDQLDMQYWDAVNGTTTWEDALAKVKSDNPKPK